MTATVPFGRRDVALAVPAEKRLATPPAPADLADPAAALAAALEEPFHFPPLRQALTPDDRVAVVVDAALPGVGALLGPVLDHVTAAGVEPQAVTLVSAGPDEEPPWRRDLPAIYRRVAVVAHDPANAKGLCYLATTKDGRRVYLDRAVVEADQVVVVSGRRYDPVLGYAGAEAALYPALGDREALDHPAAKLRPLPPGDDLPPPLRAAREVAWLLGAPFFVQAIEGSGDGVASFVTGTVEASDEGRRRQDARWKIALPRPADLVVATLPGDPATKSFADHATAVSRAARAVGPRGAVVLLTESPLDAGSAGDFLAKCDDPDEALRKLGRQPESDLLAAWLWAGAAQHARVYLHSPLEDDAVERLFATPLDDLGQVQRLVDRAASVLVLADAQKALPVVE